MARVCWLLALALGSPAWAAGEAPAQLQATAAPGLQVWLQTQSNDAGQTVLLPYVKALQAVQLHASVSVRAGSSAGNARVGQQDRVEVPAGRPVLLARLALGLAPHDVCVMDVVLSELPTYKEVARYRIVYH